MASAWGPVRRWDRAFNLYKNTRTVSVSLISRLAQYAQTLPPLDWERVPTLGEGSTPLVRSLSIGPRCGVDELYFKLESCNPTGSYKDRFVLCELGMRQAQGYTMCLATSSGNTGSSLASYAVRFGMRCHIFVLEETPAEKLQQMVAHGAHVHRVRGYGTNPAVTEAVPVKLRELCEKHAGSLVISAYRYCPEGMEGVKTIAYEIAEQMGSLPEHLFVPVGGGGLCSAVSRGVLEQDGQGEARVHAVQPSTNDTIVTPLRQGMAQARSVERGTSVSGLGVLNDIDGTRAIGLVRQTGGSGFLPSEEEILQTQRQLLEEEGVYAEPAGATAVAGFKKAVAEGVVSARERVVCLITGHGFKDASSLPNPQERAGFIALKEIDERVG